MSSEALAWAFKQDVKSSSAKFTLVAYSECANYKTGLSHPSVEHLTEITGQNRKTVIANTAQLEADGLLTDTGERIGRTKQIKVYRLAIETVPKTEPSQKRNSTVSGRKESQKRDTEPSLEPSTPIISSSEEMVPVPISAENDDTPLTVDELVEDWNALATQYGLPTVAKLTDRRRRQAQARLRQYPDLEAWQRAFACIRGSPWMHGQNDRGWRADFDFLLQDKSFTKLVEGSYGQA